MSEQRNNSMIKLPILPPNGPGGSYILGADEAIEGCAPYPSEAQTHAYVLASMVVAIEPSPVTQAGRHLPGCDVFLAHKICPIRVLLRADDVVQLIDRAAQ